MPEISIIVPVYNSERCLSLCLDSLLEQSLQDWKAVCINDASTDGSGEIFTRYMARDSRGRVITQTNAGTSAARNKLSDRTRWEDVAVMDHDDSSLLERFAKEVAYLNSRPDVGVCSCWADIPSGEKVGRSRA